MGTRPLVEARCAHQTNKTIFDATASDTPTGFGFAPQNLINEQSNSDLLLGFIFVSLPFEFFQKRGPHKVGDANKFMPRCALNFEEHGVRYAGLDRSAVGSRKYFTALALSKGVGLRLWGTAPRSSACGFRKM